MMSLNKAWAALKSAVGAAPTVVAASSSAVEQVPHHLQEGFLSILAYMKDTVLVSYYTYPRLHEGH